MIITNIYKKKKKKKNPLHRIGVRIQRPKPNRILKYIVVKIPIWILRFYDPDLSRIFAIIQDW